ncbi:MAG: cellulase family glycosylhydrolase [Acidimicrobiia bacterium]
MVPRPRVLLLALLAVVGLVTAACVPRPRFEPPVGPRAELGHSGRWFTDRWGRVVNLRGVNFVKKFPPISPAAAGFGEDDARLLRDEGFNAVRLGVVFGAVMPEPGVIDHAYVDSIASTVRVLAREGIFTLLDVHQDGYGPSTHGNGFPDWATLTDGLPNPSDPFPTYYVTNPALQRAFDNFWTNRPGPDGVGLQTHYAEALRAVAASVADEDYVLGYDLMNEPWPGTDYQSCITGCPDLEQSLIAPFAQRMTAAIRSVDHDHIVFTEPFVLFNFGQTDTSISGFGAPESGLSFHVYALDPASDASVMDRAVAASARGDAIIATEFGATRDRATLLRLTDGFDSRLIPWIFWSYDGNVVPDLTQPPTGANVHDDVLDALVRPNPMVTNGTPTAASYDPDTRVYDYSYATTRPDGRASGSGLRTSLVLPHRVYPDGYTVTVEGATVRECTTTLVLRNQPGAATVHVHITPGGPCAKPRLP